MTATPADKLFAQVSTQEVDGDRVKLIPLDEQHIDPLCEIGLDEALWQWTPRAIRNRQDMEQYVSNAIAGRVAGSMLPYAIFDKSSGKIVGSTRYGALELAHKRGEIGWTWVGREWQRTHVNTECKLLLLANAFGTLALDRVELRTDVLNDASRRAIERLGAVKEGVLRQHMVTATGRIRDTVVYSIIRSEWPATRQQLEGKLRRQ